MDNDLTSAVGSPANEPPDHADAGLYCPECGYDLRGTTSQRCSECGTPIDRATLKVSRLPWVHRKELGRLRAWRRTVWLVIRHPKALAEEMARPVDWPAASRFRWIMVALATAIVALAFAGVYHWWPEWPLGPRVAGPWEGGNPLEWPIVFICDRWGFGLALVAGTAVGLAAATWWVRLWFWMLGGPGHERASALILYLSVWMIAVSLLGAGLLGVRAAKDFISWWGSSVGITTDSAALAVAAVSAPVLLVGWMSTLVLLRRTARCGWIALTMAAVGIPVGVLVILATALLASAYGLGMAALMLRSLW